MGRTRKKAVNDTPVMMRPALTPEARENQLISLAVDLAERGYGFIPGYHSLSKIGFHQRANRERDFGKAEKFDRCKDSES